MTDKEDPEKNNIIHLGERLDGPTHPSFDVLELEQPQWGEDIWIGYFLGKEQIVRRPLNRTAQNLTEPWIALAVMLGERVKTLEERLAQIEDKLE